MFDANTSNMGKKSTIARESIKTRLTDKEYIEHLEKQLRLVESRSSTFLREMDTWFNDNEHDEFLGSMFQEVFDEHRHLIETTNPQLQND